MIKQKLHIGSDVELVLLALRLLYRQRELRTLRAQVAEAMALEARRATRLRARVGVLRSPTVEGGAGQQPVAVGSEPVDFNS